ncbi:actin-related protein Arp6 [Mycena amicta]|nr:actin-related protein Arp6 [Mycena amicta]
MVVVVLDNGGSSIKAGVAGQQPCRVISNAVVRSKGDRATYVGHELETKCTDHSALGYRLPIEKGYIVDWDAQKAIWDGVLSDEVLNVNPTTSTLIITEPYFNLPKIQDTVDQFIFEEYEFKACYRATPASFIPHGSLFQNDLGEATPECMLIVDSGFSFTHVVPLIEGIIVWDAVKRLDVGSKLLTNQLKELVSFRQWNMMDETYIMNHVKETCCFVSQDFKADLEICRIRGQGNSIVQEYLLPDLAKSKAGRIRAPDDIPLDTDQVLTMGNERFAVPEVIFRPDDIGMNQAGLAETIAASIALLPEDIQGLFWANIGLIGGNTKFVGFRSRLLKELQSLAPVGCEVDIYQSTDSILDAYNAATTLASSPSFTSKLAVTRAEYLEHGSSAMRRKMRAAGNDWQVRMGPRERFDGDRDEGEDDLDANDKGKGKEKEKEKSQAPRPRAATRSTRQSTGNSGAPTTAVENMDGRRTTRARAAASGSNAT